MKSLLNRLTASPLPEHAFRVLFSLIFVVAGFGHLRNPAGIVTRLQGSQIGAWLSGFAPATWLVVASGAVLLAAGLALLLGVRTRLAALALILCLIPITISVQLEPGSTGPLFKNIALLGGLIHFALKPAAATATAAAHATTATPALEGR